MQVTPKSYNFRKANFTYVNFKGILQPQLYPITIEYFKFLAPYFYKIIVIANPNPH